MFGKLWGDKQERPAAPPSAEAVPPAADAPGDPLEGIEFTADGRATLTLKWPVQFGKTLVETITMRRPRAEDLRRLKTVDPAQMAPYDTVELLGALVEGQPRAFIDKLDLEDFARMGKVLARFFPDGLPIGRSD